MSKNIEINVLDSNGEYEVLYPKTVISNVNFDINPTCSISPTSNNQLANKKYVDDLISENNVKYVRGTYNGSGTSDLSVIIPGITTIFTVDIQNRYPNNSDDSAFSNYTPTKVLGSSNSAYSALQSYGMATTAFMFRKSGDKQKMYNVLVTGSTTNPRYSWWINFYCEGNIFKAHYSEENNLLEDSSIFIPFNSPTKTYEYLVMGV